ncbi:hypothetical protein GLOIN_2v1880501 [Rhizophagus irregularis DAOM 181602=DAOM 197198]|nr:hypothetical protein GLOIN_2v1880501 [Rhizophagus irregularis DAOM 181602=DAOM 197198]
MPFANIRISKGSRVLHGWYIHPLPYEMSLKDFFMKLVNKEISPECNIAVTSSEEIERIELSEALAASATQASLNCNIIELTKGVGIYIHYRLKTDITTATPASQNGFAILMQNARKSKLYLPTFPQSGNRKQTLRNDLVDWIHNNGGGWSTQSYANTQGKEFIVSLTEAIWYIDMRSHKKLEERSFHIPNIFLEFFDRANPESHKHSRKLFDANELNLHCQSLAPCATSSWMLMANFDWLRGAFDNFIVAISNYTGYLQCHRNVTAVNHASESPYDPSIKQQRSNNLPPWKPVDLEEYLPNDPVQRMRYIQGLPHAFSFKIGEYRFSSGNNAFNAISIWKVDEHVNEDLIIQENTRIVMELQADAPRYHTRAMRINYLRTCDLLLPKAKPSALRTIYRMLTGDISAAENAIEAKVDERVRLALELGDPEITIDLREHNDGQPGKYNDFWKITAQFLAGKAADTVTAVDERRHDTVVHLATAISVNDLLHQIKHECSPEILIPSAQWLRLQFWPKNPTWLSSLQFTGRLPLKFMVQTRQLRANHQDAHYASALFRYEKEFAVKFREITNMIFLDDKHRCKVGEPGFPVAAIERGKKVVVSKDTTFTVADHDFTKTGIIPSVVMICDIPESINGDFYVGKVRIGLKDPIFQPSSPLRHATELFNILLDENLYNKPVLCFYTDGGPDYRFRTPPQHSWKNLVECIMSILNLGLQSVGLMRAEMNDQSENLMSKCGTMNEIRKIAEENPNLKEDLITSLQVPIHLIRDVFSHQALKGEPFKTFPAASETEIERFWKTIQIVDDSEYMQEFLEHCCKSRHYFFSIKKCGESTCTICRPIRCSTEDFEQLHHLPDPVPGEDLHYISFEKLYGTPTTEDHRPSFRDAKAKKKENMTTTKVKHSMPFCPSAVRAKNVGVVVNCAECEKPRLLFSARKLSKKDRTRLQSFLDTIFYTCGMSFHNTCDLAITTPVPSKQHDEIENLDEGDDCNEDEPENSDDENESDNNMKDSIRELFSRVFVNDSWSCTSQIKKPYYSAGIYPDVCIECGSLDINETAEDKFPHCSSCSDNTAISKKRLKWKQGGKDKGKRTKI